MIKTNWIYSTEYEAKRLIETSYLTANGFYKSGGFLVLNKLHKDHVFLPYISNKSIESYWKRVFDVKYKSFPIVVKDKKLLKEVTNWVEKKYTNVPNVSKIQRLWEVIGDHVIKETLDIINLPEHSIKEINIYISNFGTGCTFSITKNLPSSVDIYLRHDQDLNKLVYALISSLTRNNVLTKYQGEWEHSQFLAEWLISETRIGKLLESVGVENEFRSTLKNIKKVQSSELSRESEKYYKKLKLASDYNFEVKDNSVIVNDKELDHLVSREKELMKLLLKNKNRPVDIDSISEVLFKNEDEFSLYAVSKAMQRLRNKLEKNNVSPNFIQTVRNQGFMIKN